MSEQTRLSFWPFLVADAFLVGVALVFFRVFHRPLEAWEAGVIVVCVLCAAGSFLFYFLRQNSNEQAIAEAHLLADSISQINKIEAVSAQISNATGQWQSVQGYAIEVADTAKGLADSMAREARAFGEFLQKANDSEKAHLRLEVDKLRRAEMEWVQILTRILDHVFALMAGAQKLGQQNVIEQIGQFQNVCLDTARRVGLMPIVPLANEKFDSRIHQPVEEVKTPEADALIKGTIVSGYNYQGQLIRKAAVHLKENEV